MQRWRAHLSAVLSLLSAENPPPPSPTASTPRIRTGCSQAPSCPDRASDTAIAFDIQSARAYANATSSRARGVTPSHWT
eukprot:949572-Rhodomonas_salina.2